MSAPALTDLPAQYLREYIEARRPDLELETLPELERLVEILVIDYEVVDLPPEAYRP